jgi:hypothetical protein
MPAISLVVCVHRQRNLLERLIRESKDCCDELVVIHDGKDVTNVREIVEKAGGRFIESERRGSLEAQSPFAWAQATHDWILRLDADEFPSQEMKTWLREFRHAPEPPPEISGYTCIWPLWNGRREVSKKWPAGRIFLFHRQRVKFFGMVEQTPVPDGVYQPLDFILHHQPERKSYGLHNILVRKQAYLWRERIATSLLGKPTDLPCWRWTDENWPLGWEQIRRRPIWTMVKRFTLGTLRTLREQWKAEKKLFPAAAISGPAHHASISFKLHRLKRKPNK